MAFATHRLNVPQTESGISLGGLAHQSTSRQPPEPVIPLARTETSDSEETLSDDETWASGPSRPKSAKWKIFGGLFGGSKKNIWSSKAFYQVKPEMVVQTIVEENHDDSGVRVSPNLRSIRPSGRSRAETESSIERRNEQDRPTLRRAQTAPLNLHHQDSTVPATRPGTPKRNLDGGALSMHSNKSHVHERPVLNVEIPSIQMERYSVMFRGLLPKSTSSSSSLLARRQATLDRLKKVKEAIELQEKEVKEKEKLLRLRRATSPQPTKSLSFSSFPNTPSRLATGEAPYTPSRSTSSDSFPSSHYCSPRQRANTSPAVLSPSRHSFDLELDNETHATLLAPGPHVPILPESEDQRTSHQKRERKPTTDWKVETTSKPQPCHNWRPESSRLSLDSSTTEDEDEDEDEEEISHISASLAIKPKFEPTWQMITQRHEPASSTSGSASSQSDSSTSTSASSISTTSVTPLLASNFVTANIQPPPPPYPRSHSVTTTSAITPSYSLRKNSEASATSLPLPSQKSLRTEKKIPEPPEDGDLEQRLESAADICIARQISISRKQFQLLAPIRANSNSELRSNQSLPSPHNPINTLRAVSPLVSVATATRAESELRLERNGRSLDERKAPTGQLSQRLTTRTAKVKPVTPTLMVVEDGCGERERGRSGRAVEQHVSGGKQARVLRILNLEKGRRGLSHGEMNRQPYRRQS